MDTFKEYIGEAGTAPAEPLHWVIDKFVPNCILLKRGRKSVVAIDFDGKNYTVMLDPKERSSMGCQKSSFKDAIEMTQGFLKGTVEGGQVPECPSNIRRWLKHGQDKIEESVKKALSEDEWEKATSAIPKDFLEWKKGSEEGEALLMRGRKRYIKICKRLPSKQNSDFYQKWVEEMPYSMKLYAYSIDNKTRLFWEYPDLKSVLAAAEQHKKMDYSANGLNFPVMPKEIREWLRKGRRDPNAEVVSESTAHVFRWEFYERNPNRVSLILDGRYEVASIFRNAGMNAVEFPYAVEVYSFNHASEFVGLEKTIADACSRLAKEIVHPEKLNGDPQMAGVESNDVVIPPMPTSARLWLDKSFDESVLSEKK